MSWHKFISCHIVFNKHWLITAWYFWTTWMLFFHHSGKDRNISAAVWWTAMKFMSSYRDYHLLASPLPFPSSVSGTTCLVALLSDKELTVANVGDSRGVLCDKDGNAIPLSHDHKPYQLKERKRIKKAGEKMGCDPDPYSLYSEQQKRLQLKLEGASKLTLLLWKHEMSLLMIKAKSHCTVLPPHTSQSQADIKTYWLITLSASKAACYQNQPDGVQCLRCNRRRNSPSNPICILSAWGEFDGKFPD